MSEHKKDGGPAFPSTTHTAEGHAVNGPEFGMTLRDYFAAKALVAWVGAYNHPEPRPFSRTYFTNAAEAAYELADAMLAERSKS